MESRKIDLVYTWVNGNDTEWKKKKIQLQKQLNCCSNVESESILDCRFTDNDELKYSLRSVEKYIPWINHIFIVTDNQKPDWLNTNHPKLTIIDHKEIIPKDCLPTFNSVAIENCICNIKNLSEYFLYACDDMYFVNFATPDFFYTKNNYPICRFRYLRKNPKKTQFNTLIYNARKMVENKYNKKFEYNPHHCIDAYRKSDFMEFQKVFKKEVDEVIHSQFRNSNSFERTAYLFYACAINHGRAKLVKKIDLDLPFTKRIINYLMKKYAKDSIYFSNKNSHIKDSLKKYNPTLICINDCEKSTTQDKENIKNILEQLFPDKSSFEL
ncbi:MAG: Stealth CR1 domain-containing protein [Candidatus Gastranaerophilales bacterium]|nr:Stealth CR1 domain-containing protein [Candidatus Gastranaerophilales bacterium]